MEEETYFSVEEKVELFVLIDIAREKREKS
jgi:hypothetical protein